MVISAADLKKTIHEAVNEAKREMQDDIAKFNSETLLTSKQVIDQLSISRTTLWNWKNRGFLVPIEIGGKQRYKLSDINSILQKYGSANQD